MLNVLPSFVSGHLSSEEVYNDFSMRRPDIFSILIDDHKYPVQIAESIPQPDCPA